MQLKRIKKIKNVGLFFDCVFGSTDFPKTTLIYGLNGYGKSTLSDIFRSISQNDPNIIISKQTIHHKDNPECEICFSTEGSAKETNICFKSNVWDNRVENIEIFDSRFVSENVYSDFEITYEHKKNISALILGETGSLIAKSIADLEKDIREARSKERMIADQIKNNFPKEYNDSIDDFLSIKEEKKSELKQKSKLQKELKTITETETITGLKELKNIILSHKAEDVSAHIEGMLLHTPSEAEIDKEAIKKTEDYIKKIGGNSERWLFQGLEYHKSETCPFCTQDTSDVSDVISAYKNYFSNEYKKFANNIGEKLDQYEQECGDYFNEIEQQELALSNNLIFLNNIKDFITDEEFTDYSKSIQDKHSEIQAEIKNVLAFKSAFLALINSKIEKKKAQPLIAQNLNGFDRIKFSDKGNDLDKKIIAYNKTIVKVNGKIQNLKNTANKKQNKLEVEHKIAYLNLVEIRFSETLITLVTEYEAVKKLLDSKEKEREQKEKELADHNEQISNKCLAEVNRILKECGCRYVIKLPDNFSKKGYSPVLEIWFTLFGKDVPINKFGEVLSDSDKRVLALAFFIAQLNTDREKLKETIIILDDPFTSFDDDRIEQVFTIIKEVAANAKQIIILSHYGKPLAHLSSELNGHLQLKIKNSDKGSTLEQTDLIKLLSNQHENRLDKLDNAVSDSIEEKDVVSLKSDLRIVIEDEIKTRFRQQLKGTNITTLGSLIDKIEELNKDNKVSFKESGEKVITALREINERTSREHHSNPNYQNNQISTPEGIKTTIKNAFDLIYTKL